MSHAEYASKPLPVLTRLAGLLRHIPAVQFVIAKFGKLLRSHDASIEPVVAGQLLPAGISGDTNDAVGIDDVVTPVATPAVEIERDEPVYRGLDARPEPVIEDSLPIPAPGVVGDLAAIEDVTTPVATPAAEIVREEPVCRRSHDAIPEPVVEDSLPIPAPSVVSDIATIEDVATPVATPADHSESEVLVHRRSLDASPEALVDDTPLAPDIPNDTVEIDDVVTAVAQPPELSEREQLVRRRWSETGIRMWNPLVYGAGHAALNIQGRVELLPPRPGETMPRYDTLEFRLVEGRIVCEGFVVDPPERPVNRQFVGAARRT